MRDSHAMIVTLLPENVALFTSELHAVWAPTTATNNQFIVSKLVEAAKTSRYVL